MALYDLAFPDSTRPARSAALCAVLNLEPHEVPRLRDSWAELVDGVVQGHALDRVAVDGRDADRHSR